MTFPSVVSTTVDSTPTIHLSPPIIISTLPIKSSMQCPIVVGLGLPDRFAEGAAIGVLESSINFLATLFEGILIPTHLSPAVTLSGIMSDFGIIIVIGPGQKASISNLAF